MNDLLVQKSRINVKEALLNKSAIFLVISVTVARALYVSFGK